LGSSLYEDCSKSSSVPYRKRNFAYIAQTKRELFSRSWNEDLDLLHYFLSLEFWQKTGEIFLSQGKYAVDVLRRFGHDGLQVHEHTNDL
jgi:hypothetical protein